MSTLDARSSEFMYITKHNNSPIYCSTPSLHFYSTVLEKINIISKMTTKHSLCHSSNPLDQIERACHQKMKILTQLFQLLQIVHLLFLIEI